ncbi:MAG TPA: maleylpyruvate isomerase family mycothiol-dependent enzyme [Candidatus Dormibacteraeota bacterium]
METATLIDTLERLYGAVGALCEELGPEEWALPTGCPGWTVKDNLAHIVGLDAELCGQPLPEVELPDLERLADPFKRHMEIAVEARRALAPRQIQDEFRTVSAAYVAQLRALQAGGDPDPEVNGPMGRRGLLRRFLPIRIFDVWSHEQDIRRATGRPGDLDSAAAEVSFRAITRQLGVVLGEAGVPAGTEVAVEVGGAMQRRFEVVTGERGDGAGRAGPAAVLHLDVADFVARACGRRDGSGEFLGAVEVTGNPEVGARLLEHMAVTP